MIYVALRKESVDRNTLSNSKQHWASGSLSARRAWIEISEFSGKYTKAPVALRKESVDRNS